MTKDLQELIGKYKQQIDAELDREIERRLAEVKSISPHLIPVLEAMRELSVGGKRLRAILVIVGYELSRKEVNDEVVKSAAAMELFHLGILIQDDVMDRDGLRRGVKTLHMRYRDLHLGESIAMCAGDFTYGWCIEILSHLNLPASRVNAAMSVWGRYFTRLGYGQILDVQDIADEETILQILSIKSGEYSCVLPLLLGATLGGAEAELLERLESYGMELGATFQLRDDWLGMWGDSSKTGKPAGEQDVKGKKTFATMYGKEKTEQEIARHLGVGMKLAGTDELLTGLIDWVATREN